MNFIYMLIFDSFNEMPGMKGSFLFYLILMLNAPFESSSVVYIYYIHAYFTMYNCIWFD